MSQISQKAADMLEAWISKHGTDDKQALIDYAYSLTGRYGQAAGALACQMYEATAAAQGAVVQTAEMAELPERWEVAKAVQGTMKQSQAKIPDTAARLVKQVGADTTLKNARRDGAQFAWIPHGDTCAFCVTLASRGWQDISKNALRNGHAEHIHANCDCEYAVRFDGHSTVAGYDPEKYLEEYNAAGGDINAMRRARYAENKDRINAQKRVAYAERKVGEREQAGLQDVLAEYLNNAQPGAGTVTYEDGYHISHHSEEIKIAKWLHENFGGDIVLLAETGGLHEKTPDFLWRGKGWELKTTTTEKSADSALRSALKQILKNPGGVILDYGDNEVSIPDAEKIVLHRLERQEKCTTDILILNSGKIARAIRYKK